MPGGKIVPILLGALRPRRTHEGPWCGQNPTGYELVAASAVRSLGLRLGFTPRFDRGAIELNTRRSTHAERRRPALIVIGLVTFLKPCRRKRLRGLTNVTNPMNGRPCLQCPVSR